MRDHASIERAFAAALKDPNRLPSPVVTSHTSRTPVWRLNVYRNNVYASLTRTLRARFPVIERLVGEDFFAGIARAYIDLEPPRSPVLLAYAEGFPAFLERFEPVADLPYLPDVARVEWLVHHAYHAADCIPLEAHALSNISAEAIGALRFKLAPSLGVMSSDYPVYTIWRANTHDSVVGPIGPESGPECVLAVRVNFEVELIRISRPAADFVTALSKAKTLMAAAAIAEAAGRHRLDQTLATLIRHSAIAGFASAPHPSHPLTQETTP